MKIAVSYYDRLKWLPNQNFKGLCDSLLDCSSERDVFACSPDELLQRHDYDAVFLIRGGQAISEEHVRHYKSNGILICVWHDDLFGWQRLPRSINDICVWQVGKFACHCPGLLRWFEAADLLFIPYVNLFAKYKGYQRFRHKVVWMPWSAPDALLAESTPWAEREDRVVLSGHMYKQYSLRREVGRYAATDEGGRILVSLEHHGYGPQAQKKMLTGRAYHEFLMRYKGAIATSAVGASDFHRAKYMEVAGSGCLPFFEYTRDMHFLGFVDGVNCVLIDAGDYKRKLNCIRDEDAARIAANARELIRERHLHSHRARAIIATIRQKLGMH